MMTFDEFMKKNEPAYGEVEKQYFMRMSAEYTALVKGEAAQLRKQRWLNGFKELARLLVIEPNPNLLRSIPFLPKRVL